jgi:hypothetical protein
MAQNSPKIAAHTIQKVLINQPITFREWLRTDI